MTQNEATRQPELWDTPRVAKALSVSERAVVRLISSGELQSVKVGGLRRIRPEWVEAYIAGLEVPA